MADDTMTDAREASSGASPVVVPTPKSKGKKSTKAVSRPLPSSSLEHSGTPNAIPPTTPNKIRKPASKNGSATPGTVRKLNASSKASNSNGSDTPSKKGSTSAAKNDPATPTSKGASKDMATPPASIAKLVNRESGEVDDDEAEREEYENAVLEAVKYREQDEDGEYEGDATINGEETQALGRDRMVLSEDGEFKYKTKPYTFNPKNETHPNGRVKGRRLVMWHRPRMLEKLLLHLVYECHRNDVKLPWDKVMARLAPGSSVDSALQQMNKTREIMITEGHMVPPLKSKRCVPADPDVRGIIRDMSSENPSATRTVNWTEDIEDLKRSLEIPGIIRGSGRYPRTPRKPKENGEPAADATTPSTNNPSTLKKRTRKVKEGETSSAEATPTKKPKKSTAKKSAVKAEESASENEVLPEELVSDEDYKPNATVKKNRHGKRIVKKTISQRELSPLSHEEFEDSDTSGEYEHVEGKSHPITFRLSPEKLKRFPAGVSGAQDNENGLQDYQQLNAEDLQSPPYAHEALSGADNSMHSPDQPYTQIYEENQGDDADSAKMDEYDFDDSHQYDDIAGVGYQPGPTNPSNYMTGYEDSSQPRYYAGNGGYMNMPQYPASRSSFSSTPSSFGSTGFATLDAYGFSDMFRDLIPAPLNPTHMSNPFGQNQTIGTSSTSSPIATGGMARYAYAPSTPSMSRVSSTPRLSTNATYDGAYSSYGTYTPSRSNSSSRDRTSSMYRQPSIVPHTTPSFANMEDAPNSNTSQDLTASIETDENAAPVPETATPSFENEFEPAFT